MILGRRFLIDLEKRKFCIEFLTAEVKRSYAMGSKVIVLHPGNALGLSVSEAIDNICNVVNQIIENTKDTDVCIAFETMSGKGTEVGRNFDEVRMLLDGIIDKSRVGVCIDTCHMHDSGYDLVNDYDNVKKLLDEKKDEKIEMAIDERLEPIVAEIEELRKYIRDVGQVEKHHMDLIISSYRFRLV